MDYLKEGIGLRAMAQRDPLVEYQREGYDMFIGMLEGLKEESVGFLFNVAVEAAPAPAVAPGGHAAGSGRVRRGRRRQGRRAGRCRHQGRAACTGTALRAKGIDDERAAADLQRPVRGRLGGGAATHRRRQAAPQWRRTQSTERREAARQQARDTKRRG